MTDAHSLGYASESPPPAAASVTDTRGGGVSGALLLEPHQDDGVLFASFTILRIRPTVVTVFGDARSQADRGVTALRRNDENARARDELDRGDPRRIDGWSLPFIDTDPDWRGVQTALEVLATDPALGDVYAPFPEPGGHPQHNQLGELAVEVFGPERVTHYTTYRFGGPKTRGPVEVEPEPDWIIRKLRALACFESQILHGPRRFFMEDLREYQAPAVAA